MRHVLTLLWGCACARRGEDPPDPPLAIGGRVQEGALHVRHRALHDCLIVADGHRKRLVWIHLQEQSSHVNSAQLSTRCWSTETG